MILRSFLLGVLVTLLIGCSEDIIECEDAMEWYEEEIDYCNNFDYTDDTMIVTALHATKDSCSELLIKNSVGMKLAGHIIYHEESKFTFFLRANFSEKLDSLSYDFEFDGELQHNEESFYFSQLCFPHINANKNIIDSQFDSLHFYDVTYNISCISKVHTMRFKTSDNVNLHITLEDIN
jgi:hypothetical protein